MAGYFTGSLTFGDTTLKNTRSEVDGAFKDGFVRARRQAHSDAVEATLCDGPFHAGGEDQGLRRQCGVGFPAHRPTIHLHSGDGF